jgi:hypothetical protein
MCLDAATRHSDVAGLERWYVAIRRYAVMLLFILRRRRETPDARRWRSRQTVRRVARFNDDIRHIRLWSLDVDIVLTLACIVVDLSGVDINVNVAFVIFVANVTHLTPL